MASDHGGVKWYLKLLLDRGSRRKVEEELKKTGERAGTGMGKGVDRGMKQSLDSVLRYVKGIFGLQLAREIGNALHTAGQAITAFVQKGAQLDRLSDAFNQLASSAGLSGNAILKSMREASRGMVSDLELMRQANMAMQVGLPVTAEGLGELVYLSRRLAEATGREAPDALDRMVKGIGKLEIELLDELGLLGGVKGALAAYERETGKNADSLDQASKQQLYYNATIEEARQKVAAMGEEQLDAGERLQQFTTFWENLNGAVALAILESPRIADFFDSIGVGAQNAGDRVQELADKIGALVDTYGTRFLDAIISGAEGAAAGGLAGAVAAFFTGGSSVLGGAVIGGAYGAARGWMSGERTGTFEEHLARRQAAHTNQALAAWYGTMSGRPRSGGGAEPAEELTPEQKRKLKRTVDTMISTLEARIRATNFGRDAAPLRDITTGQPIRSDVVPRGPGIIGKVEVPGLPGLIQPDQLSQFQQLLELTGFTAEDTAARMTYAFEGFFTTLFDGLSKGEDLFESFADATVGIGKAIVASMTEGMAQWQMAEGIADLAAGTWPPNPQALGAASIHFAAAGLFRALGSLVGGRGGSGYGGGLGLPTGPRDPSMRAEQIPPRPIVLQLDVRGILDPQNPVLARGIGEAMDLDVRLAGKRGWMG